MVYLIRDHKLTLDDESAIIQLIRNGNEFAFDFRVSKSEYETLKRVLNTHKDPDVQIYFLNTLIISKLLPTSEGYFVMVPRKATDKGH